MFGQQPRQLDAVNEVRCTKICAYKHDEQACGIKRRFDFASPQFPGFYSAVIPSVDQAVSVLGLEKLAEPLQMFLTPWKRKRTSAGATLAYVKLTMNCVECHKLAREQRLISLAPR
jgi:hypothetical protein